MIKGKIESGDRIKMPGRGYFEVIRCISDYERGIPFCGGREYVDLRHIENGTFIYCMKYFRKKAKRISKLEEALYFGNVRI